MLNIRISDTVRLHLLAVWGAQSCRNPAHWPDVLSRSLHDGVGLANGMTRTSFAPRVDAAVATLAARLAAGEPIDGATVWRCFPMLGRQNAAELARTLVKAAAELREPVP